MAQVNEISSYQSFLFGQITHWVIKNNYSVVTDSDNYYSFNDGKRFYSLHFGNGGKTFFGIREDGNTRYVFNGTIENFEDFKRIDHLTK